MYRKLTLIILFCLSLFGDYNNISLSELLKKVAFLNNINIVIPTDTNFSTYTISINKRITAHDLLQVANTLLHEQGFLLKKIGKFYYIQKIKVTTNSNSIKHSYTSIYKVKNSNAKILISQLHTLYPDSLKAINNRYIYITTKSKTQMNNILNILGMLDITPVTYYVYLKVYDIDTNFLTTFGITFPNLDTTQGSISFNAPVPKHFPINLTALENNNKAKLLASPMLVLTPDVNNTAIFTEGMNIPIKITQTKILNGTNPIVKEVSKTIYKNIGLTLKLKYRKKISNKIEFILSLTDSNILNITQDSITTTNRTIKTLIQAKLNTPIFIAGLGRESRKEEITGIPILKDIPLIGMFFKRKKTTNSNRTLLITLLIKEQK